MVPAGDRFSGDRMARAQSLVTMVFMIVPMLAPSLGQAVMWVAGWRYFRSGCVRLAGSAPSLTLTSGQLIMPQTIWGSKH